MSLDPYTVYLKLKEKFEGKKFTKNTEENNKPWDDNDLV